MAKEYGAVPAQQLAQRLSDEASLSLLGAWRAFVEIGQTAGAGAGTALATAAPVMVEP
jgi:hypothetical protein